MTTNHVATGTDPVFRNVDTPNTLNTTEFSNAIFCIMQEAFPKLISNKNQGINLVLPESWESNPKCFLT